MNRRRDPATGPSASITRRLRSRLHALLHRDAAESDLDDELRFHLDMETEYQMRMGLPETEARQRARKEFGGVERYRDESRDARGVSAIEDFIRDLRVSVRALRRAPGFALVSIFTVALGVGATTAVFSIVDGILIRPLPYPDPGSLVRIYERSAKYPTSSFTGANFHDVEARNRTLKSVAAYGAWDETVLGLEQPLKVTGAFVTPRFFDVLEVRPSQGRGFLPTEGRSDQPSGIVVSDRFWRNWLHARPDWSTQMLHTDQGDGRIIGIMPPGFSYPAGVDLWTAGHDDNPSRSSHNWAVVGRIADGKSISQVQSDLDQLLGSLKAQYGKDMDAEGVTVRTLREALTIKVKTLCLVLLAAVVFVLLVACTNLASANLARGESQQREIAVRASLGAARGRLVRQLATEKILLCTVGGLLGVALSWALVRAAVVLGSGTIPAFATVTVDLRVMAFGLAMAILTGLVTGIIPAMSVTSDLRAVVASSGGGAGKRGSLRGPLIATEVAFATVLVIGAGLFLRSFKTLVSQDPGYRVEQLVLGDITLPSAGYANHDGGYGDTLAIPRFFTAALTRLRATPGASAVALTNQIPLGANNYSTGFAIDGATEVKGNADYRVVDSAFFSTMGIPFIRGRGFTSADRSGTEPVTIINRETAETFWPGINPLGHRMRVPGMDLHNKEWLTVVGVVENVRQYALDQPVSQQMYVHYLQRPERMMSGSIIVRTNQPSAVTPAIRSVARSIEPNSLVELSTMQALVDQSVSARRFSMTVLSAFSALALFLAAVGIYGVLAYAVVQRQREIGVRMALGSTRGGVSGMILSDAMKAVVPGLIIGLAGALMTTRFISGMLYGVAAVDPVTFIVTPAVILAVGLAASLWPASRAAKVDPMIAMRAE